jgi:hypothetical protein
VEPLSEADSQFLHDASIWLEQKTKRAESDRVLEKLRRETEQPRRQREQRRQAPSVKERMALADRVLPDKNVPRHLQYDQLRLTRPW